MPIQPMQFQPLSFEQNNPFGTGLQKGSDLYRSFAETLAQELANQKAQRLMPFIQPQAEADLQKALLGNEYQGIVNKFAPEDYRTTFTSRGAQSALAKAQADKIRYMLEHPGYMAGAEGKTIQYLIDSGVINKNSINQQNQGQPTQAGQTTENAGIPSNGVSTQASPDAPFQTPNPLINALLNRKFAESAYKQKMVEGYNWSHLPVETKNQLIAQGYGMGVDPIKMANYVNKNMTIADIAKEEGLDPNNLPPPIYPPTNATKTRTQLVEQVGAELDYLSSATTPIIARYADSFANFSADRISDMLSNNPEAQKRFGQYIGALSVQTGLANGRVVLEGGKAGVEVMKVVKDSALKGIDQHSPIKMTKIAFEEAQKTIDEILQRGAKIRTTTGMNPFSEIGKSKSTKAEKENTESEKSTKVIKVVRDSNGKLVRK